MSEVEKKEFEQRMSALSIEEQSIAVKYFEDNVLFEELEKRSRKRNDVISEISKAIKKGEMR